MNRNTGILCRLAAALAVGLTVRASWAGGTIDSVAGLGSPGGFSGDGGPAVNADINNAAGAQINAVGNLYIADTSNHRIRKIYLRSALGFETVFSQMTPAIYDKKMIATEVTMPEDGTLTSITAYLTCDKRQDVKYAIYADNAGEPGALLAETIEVEHPMNTSWLTIGLPYTPVTAGTYWLAMTIGKEGHYYYESTGGQTRHSSYDPNAGFAPSWVDTYESNTRRISVFASYESDAGSQIIETVAGTGSAGDSGDGGPASAAQLKSPRGIFSDAAGNIYIGDTENNKVRKIDAATGIIDAVAGTGISGDSGDGGPATAAKLKNPRGVTLDSAGNLYIADEANHKIRKVDVLTGDIETIAGTGFGGDSGDGGPATAAQLKLPADVALDSAGNIYIADAGNHKIRKIDAATGDIETVVGLGTAGDTGDGGPATAAELKSPEGVVLDANDILYIGDTGNNKIRRVDSATGIIVTMAGTGNAGDSGDGGSARLAELKEPVGITTFDELVYFADRGNSRIRVVNPVPRIVRWLEVSPGN